MEQYEQTKQQTDTVVDNVISDVIGSRSGESLSGITPTKLAEFEGNNIKKMSEKSQPPTTMENTELKEVIEEKERAVSLIHQLNREKQDSQAQLDKIMIELNTSKEENCHL